MPNQFLIEWREGYAKGFTDVLPFELFRETTQNKWAKHEVKSRREIYDAFFKINVSDKSAELNYEGCADENRKHGISLGVLTLVFEDESRHGIRDVLWKGASEKIGESVLDDGSVKVHMR